MSLVAVVLAAGKGTRMKSEHPKVLHELAGAPLLHYVYDALREAGVAHVITVVGFRHEEVEAAIGPFAGWFQSFATVLQEPMNGTGHAVMLCADLARRFDRTLVMNGDMPCMTAATLGQFFQAHDESGARLSAMTTVVDLPNGFGRVVRGRDGAFEEVVEHKDAVNRPEVLAISEINGGLYLAETRHLFNLLDGLGNDNAQHEYYLPDVLGISRSWGEVPHLFVCPDPDLLMGLNTRRELRQAEQVLLERHAARHLEAGVTLLGQGIRIAPDAVIGPDTVLYPGVEVRAGCVLGQGVTVETGCVLTGAQVADGAHLKPYCVLEGAQVGPACVVGPFARLRPGAVLEQGAKVGNFVELKKTRLGPGSKANHLSYLGDAVIGRGVNVGAGTITCNYDGHAKYETVLEDEVFVGSDTQFVAPVRVGAGAVIGAGTTVTEDVPAGALAVSRTSQTNVPGYTDRKKAQRR
jgi:bifunctional UDP-N-acetylglucosamine pyrophosphorylase/glucosamine-1-phosphate N-acetyltransferase